MKWTKVTNHHLMAYQAFLEPFFSLPGVVFNCIVIDKHMVNLRKHHNGDGEKFLDVAFYLLISRNSKRYLSRNCSIRVFRDEKSPSDIARNRTLTDVLNRWFMREYLKCPVEPVEHQDSRDCDLIQLTDILTGAVSSAMNQTSSRAAKAEIMSAIARKVGRDSLHPDDMKGCPKINVWLWRPNK